MLKKLKKVLIWILVFKFIAGIVSSFGYFSHPHIIRQVDTMSVGLNYWLRWSDGVSAPYFFHNFLPGSLGGGDTPGITPMEFPILNLLIAPWFFFGHYWGFTLSFIFVLCLNYSLFIYHYKQWNRVSLNFGVAALLLGTFSIGSTYIYRIMPDFVSMLLVSISCALAFQGKPRWKSFLFLSLGLLMKPTSAIVLAVLFLKKDFWRNLIKKDLAWIIAGLFIGALYYTKGVSYLESVSDMTGYFKVGALSPIEGMKQAFFDINRFPRLLFKNFFSGWVLAPSLIIILKTFEKKYLWILFFISIQILTIFMIDGNHAYNHDYYFIGTSFLLCFLLVQAFKKIQSVRLLWFFCTLLIFFSLERGVYRLKPLWKNFYRSDALDMIEKFPDLRSKPIFTKRKNPPEIGLLFGQFQGHSKKAKYEIIQRSVQPSCSNLKYANSSFVACGKK